MTFGDDKAAATVLSAARPTAESEFIERLKRGDADAFDALVVTHSADVYALLYRLTENHEEAADLTQETFMRALNAIKSFRGESNLKTWLYRIAVNESRNRFRWWKRRNRENMISLDAAIGESETPLSETIQSGAANPEENILRREREATLREAVQSLPEIFRQAVVFCDVENLSYEEIAATLSINVGTVKSRIARGREELRRKLRDI